MDIKKKVDFIFELGHLRRIKHEGWRLTGVDRPDSVAEHSLRVVQIAYILAKMEGIEDPGRVAAMAAFHDCGECRVGDVHKVANRYVEVDEKKAVKEQTESLGEIGDDVFKMWEEIEDRSSDAGMIAKDADYLEQAFTAKEYQQLGHDTQQWIDNVGERLKTRSALKLFEEMKSSDAYGWWKDLKQL